MQIEHLPAWNERLGSQRSCTKKDPSSLVLANLIRFSSSKHRAMLWGNCQFTVESWGWSLKKPWIKHIRDGNWGLGFRSHRSMLLWPHSTKPQPHTEVSAVREHYLTCPRWHWRRDTEKDTEKGLSSRKSVSGCRGIPNWYISQTWCLSWHEVTRSLPIHLLTHKIKSKDDVKYHRD